MPIYWQANDYGSGFALTRGILIAKNYYSATKLSKSYLYVAKQLLR